MKCGEAEKRNKEYYESFNKQTYFQRLVKSENATDIIIFDVGAHRGESTILFNELFPAAKIYSFEPNPEAAESISNLRLPNVEVLQIALSDKNGTAQFFTQDISHLSSLHAVNRASKASLGYAAREQHKTIEVQVRRGADFCKEMRIPHIDILKVDVQANEVATLSGFGGFFPHVQTVIVEVSIYDFYSRTSSIAEIEGILSDFELFDIFEISKNPKTLGTDWATLVYSRKAAKSGGSK